MFLDSKFSEIDNQLNNIQAYLHLTDSLATNIGIINGIDLSFIASNASDWRSLVHTSTISTLYSIYEKSIFIIFDYWLDNYSQTLSDYYSIPEGMRKAYRHGLSEIIDKLGGPRYSQIDEKRIFQIIAQHESGLSPDLFNPAFFTQDANLRFQILSEIASSIELRDMRSWLEKNPLFSDFIQSTFEPDSTIDSELKIFVYFRNKAAHGDFSEILGSNELSKFCELIRKLLFYLCKYINLKLLNLYKNKFTTIKLLGEVTHIYSKNIYIIKSSNGSLSVGDNIISIHHKEYQEVKVISIQVENVDQLSVTWDSDLEVGIQTDIEINKPKKIHQMVSTPLRDKPFSGTDYYI